MQSSFNTVPSANALARDINSVTLTSLDHVALLPL
jgi:hypothetical protein